LGKKRVCPEKRRIITVRVMLSERLRAWAEEEVGEVVRQLPGKIRAVAGRVVISYEQAPTSADVEDGLFGDELGLFEGPSLADDPGIEEVPRIRLFLANLWDWVEEDEEVFREEVATTYLHELGHFLGWDEEEIAARGLD
jgi:predicted Zn-dependent protease with MMP-like domain